MELDGSILLCSNKEESGHGFIFVDENGETFPGSGKRAALEKKKEKKREEKLAAWLFSRDESSLRKVEPHTTKVATTYRSHSMERLARFRALER